MLTTEKIDFKSSLSKSLKDIDKELFNVIDLEDKRQEKKLIMIASESECLKPVREVLSCTFTNIYAEGYPSRRLLRETTENLPDLDDQLSYLRRYSDRRYYKGVEYADVLESLACRRVAALFANENVKAENIFVNVQSLSGAAANNAVYEAFVEPGDTVMGMDLSNGGHLTHGSHANRSGKVYNIVSYHADIETGEINFKEIEELANEYKPKMIIAGYSAFPRIIDWKRFRDIAHSVGAILLADISHIAGPIVGGAFPSPVGIADVVSFTTHKTLCGPRGAVILTTREDYGDKINNAVFPGEQGGPHLNSIAAKALLFRLANTDGFKEMQKQVVKNAKALADSFVKAGCKLAFGGTDSHMVLLDIRKIMGPDGFNLRGEIASRVLDMCGITCNKNTIPGDTSAVHPGALRFGTTWLTQRGFKEEDIYELGDIIITLLKSMVPYKYLEISGDVGRAKTPLSAIESAYERVQKLINKVENKTDKKEEKREIPARYPNFNREAPIFVTDASNYGIIEIRGDRCEYFLDEVLTFSASAMPIGEAKIGFVLTSDGKVCSFVNVCKLADKKYIIITPPNTADKLIVILKGLSDGYIMFDEKDIYAKIQGPCVVKDRRIFDGYFQFSDVDDRLTAVEVFAKGEIAEKLAKIGADIPAGRYAEAKLFGIDCQIAVCSCRHRAVILVKPDYVKELWKNLISNGFEAVGSEDTKELLESIMEFKPYKAQTAEEAFEIDKESKMDMIDMTKPYFLGMSYLNEKYHCENDKKAFEYVEKEEPLKKTLLYDKHVALKARMAPFAGYSMPVWYSGINDEHNAMRTSAGLFDVGHMGILSFEGPDACRFLDTLTSNYIPKLLNGQSQYGYLLDPFGKVIDDIMLYRRAEDKFMLVVNAANFDKVKKYLKGVVDGEYFLDSECKSKEIHKRVTIKDLSAEEAGKDRKADLAFQGPKSQEVLALLLDEPERQRFLKVKRNEFIETKIKDIELILSRTGYTGEENGYELYLNPNDSLKMWDLILEVGKDFGVKPCGLGCRDSARTEAGLPLYGHELAGDYDISPNEAGYAPFVKFHKPFFVGRRALLEAEKTRKMELVRFSLVNKNARPIKHGSVLVSKRGETMGYVTSSVIINGWQVGLAYVSKKHTAPGTRAEVFILGSKNTEKQKDQLKPGDRILLSEEAIIMTRFPSKDEFAERYNR